MSLVSSALAAVFSAFLGAIAIRSAEVIRDRRSSLKAVHYEIVENYRRLGGQIYDIERGDWYEYYTVHIRLDATEAVKARSPSEYIRFLEEISGFSNTLSVLEDLRRTQRESTRANVSVTEEPDEIVNRLEEVQEILIETEGKIRQFSQKSKMRKILYFRILHDADFDSDSEL